MMQLPMMEITPDGEVFFDGLFVYDVHAHGIVTDEISENLAALLDRWDEEKLRAAFSLVADELGNYDFPEPLCVARFRKAYAQMRGVK